MVVFGEAIARQDKENPGRTPHEDMTRGKQDQSAVLKNCSLGTLRNSKEGKSMKDTYFL